MFGSDNNQQQGVPTGAPITNDDIMKNGSLEQPDTVAGANNASDSAVPSTAASIFPPQVSADPFGTAQPAAASDDVASASTTQPTEPGDSKLLDIKQQALHHLSPLVEHLDQSAEEKFKTTMMMIQAADDKSLVPAAFESAKAIEDDKARAQALLDIINEINYFTQQ